MPTCMAIGCSNTSGKYIRGKKVSFHRMTGDETLGRLWYAALKRGDLPKDFVWSKNHVVCSDHFLTEDYEEDMYGKLMGAPKKNNRLLKKSAVPSVFVFSQPAKLRSSSIKRNEVQLHRQIIDGILSPSTSKVIGKDQRKKENCLQQSASTSKVIEKDQRKKENCLQQSAVSQSCEPTIDNFIDNIDIEPLSTTCDKGIQCELIGGAVADNTLVSSEHSYCKPSYSPTIATQNLHRIMTSTPVKKPIRIEKEMDLSIGTVSFESEESDIDMYSASEDIESESEVEGLNNKNVDKYIVFRESLMEIIIRIKCHCGDPVFVSSEQCIGSMLRIKFECPKGHNFFWHSQKLVGDEPYGNFLIPAAIIFSGNTFQRIHEFASFLKLLFVSKTTFYDEQHNLISPLVNTIWIKHKAEVIVEVNKIEELTLTGDGQCDSPGHCAKYCCYSMMEATSEKVIDLEIVSLNEVNNSQGLEKAGFNRTMKRCKEITNKIDIFASDRHNQVEAEMSKKYPSVKHQFDVWHMSKSLRKKLTKKVKKKENELLGKWVQSIVNHLWWSASTCQGDPELLREKWVSIIYHVTNKHRWKVGTKFHKCEHKRLTRQQIKQTEWLKPGSPPHEALKEVVQNTRFLKDVGKLSEFCHTGALEVYHSLQNKYRPKRLHFGYEGMVLRSQIAALDHNANVKRKQAVIKSGPRKGELRYRYVCPKQKKEWICRPVVEEKSYDHVFEMMREVERQKLKTSSLTLESVVIPEVCKKTNIAPVERPPKQELLNAFKSRFK